MRQGVWLVSEEGLVELLRAMLPGISRVAYLGSKAKGLLEELS